MGVDIIILTGMNYGLRAIYLFTQGNLFVSDKSTLVNILIVVAQTILMTGADLVKINELPSTHNSSLINISCPHKSLNY